MPEENVFIGARIVWANLAAFRDTCNEKLGRLALISVSDDGWVSGIGLTATDLSIIRSVNSRYDVLDAWEPSKLRNLTIDQVNGQIDAITNIAQAKTALKKLAQVVLWLLKREMNEF